MSQCSNLGQVSEFRRAEPIAAGKKRAYSN